jgi:hypothetical protein
MPAYGGGGGGGGYCVEDSIPAPFEAVESIRGGRWSIFEDII